MNIGLSLIVKDGDPATTRPSTGAAIAIAPHWFLSAQVRLFRRHGPTGGAEVLAELIAFAQQERDEATERVMRELAARLHPGHPYWT